MKKILSVLAIIGLISSSGVLSASASYHSSSSEKMMKLEERISVLSESKLMILSQRIATLKTNVENSSMHTIRKQNLLKKIALLETIVNDKLGIKVDPMIEQMDIVDTAVSAGNFTTLVTAVKAAGLVDTLKSEGPFTVFAPTDEAFAKLPKATLDAVLADKELLTKILTYHVVSGKVLAADVVNLTSATTVQGQDVMIDTTNGVIINDAKVVAADIITSNGVIHAIDTVLMPK